MVNRLFQSNENHETQRARLYLKKDPILNRVDTAILSKRIDVLEED